MSTFTSDWFSLNIPAWEKHLAKFKGVPCRAIELGSYEGRSACWLLENILTHHESHLMCVDINRNENLMSNLAAHRPRVQFWQQDATEFLGNLIANQFDLAYVDADHTAKDVIVQAGLLYPLIKRGGIMIFDDYDNERFTVKPAVDFFIEHWPDLRILQQGHQCTIERL